MANIKLIYNIMLVFKICSIYRHLYFYRDFIEITNVTKLLTNNNIQILSVFVCLFFLSPLHFLGYFELFIMLYIISTEEKSHHSL